MLRTLIRRTVKAAVVSGLGALVFSWFRGRESQALEEAGTGEAQWPPLGIAGVPTAEAPPADQPEPQPIEEPSDGAAAPPPPGAWIEPSESGDCPDSHPVKVKLRSGIYHVPNGASYDRANADRCYCDPASAEADGYRASKT